MLILSDTGVSANFTSSSSVARLPYTELTTKARMDEMITLAELVDTSLSY